MKFILIFQYVCETFVSIQHVPEEFGKLRNPFYAYVIFKISTYLLYILIILEITKLALVCNTQLIFFSSSTHFYSTKSHILLNKYKYVYVPLMLF